MSEPDAPRPAPIVHAERRRASLERLAALGMALAEVITERAINAPAEPEGRHEPGRAFAYVSRAMRLTLALEAKMEAQGLAWRNEEGATPEPAPAELAWAPISKDSPCPRRNKIRDGVWGAINQQVDAAHHERATESLDRLHESLIEGEDYDELLERPWRECVAAICADLGLEPDWRLWDDDAGFVRAENAPRYRWQSFWNPKARAPDSSRSAVVSTRLALGKGRTGRPPSGSLETLGLAPPDSPPELSSQFLRRSEDGGGRTLLG